MHPAVGIHVAALGLVFDLIWLLGFVFELLKLVYLVVLKFELAFELIFELGRLLGPEVWLPELLYLINPIFKLASELVGLLGLIFELPELGCSVIPRFELSMLVSDYLSVGL